MPKGVWQRPPKKPCSVTGCGAWAKSNGMCSKHESRMRRHGDVNTTAFAVELPIIAPTDTHELAWAAGFFDGEGNIGVRPAKNGRKQRVVLTIGQAGRECLDRFAAAVGVPGHVYGPRVQAVGRKPVWYYTVYKFKPVQHVVASMWKFLSSAKRDQAADALTLLKGDLNGAHC